MKTKPSKRNSPASSRPCPECGKLISSALLVCDCGYHFQTKRSTRIEAREDALERHEEDAAANYPWLTRCVPLFNIFAYISAGAAGLHLLGTLMPFFYFAQMQTSQPIVTIALLGEIVLICAGGAISFITLRALSDAARLGLATAASINTLMDNDASKRSRSKD